ncbi:YbbR-like domain-containing protein [Bacteroides sp. UBA939]|uniref:YbbR-like domain-containing protein n=1 Tax=Bacteroides sp. UBA939 TaxID=1946092 RepID=UPI0025C585CE|nr:YbbR-like domain-containing protein [Bacteroides sp. UBA939]
MFERRNIRRIYLKTARKFKDFLLSDKSREFLIFLFFFFIAGGFWLLQTLNNDYETEFSIPVRLKGVPNNVVITSEPPSELRIRVRDKGTVLLNYMLGKSFFPLTLDFSDYNRNNNHVRIYSSQFEKKLLSQLNVSTKLLSVTPDTLEYIYSTGTSKLLPVRLQGVVSAGRQYYIPDTICRPDSVLAYAPAEMLDTITVAYTQKVNLINISDTLKQQIPLLAQKGIKFVPSSVEMVFPVDIYTEKTVEVPLRGVNFPAGKALRAFPSKVNVTFQVGLSRFRQINENDFHINVSYEELLKLGSDKYTVKLNTFPKGVNRIRINPEQVDFLIEQVSSGYDN